MGVALGWIFGTPQFAATFVGEEGIAKILLDPTTQQAKESTVLLFRDAKALRVQQTRRYVNGAYTGTSYNFRWNGHTSTTAIFHLTGNYNSQKGTPPPNDPYYFATSAELAWSNYMLPRCLMRLSQGESVRFELSGANYIDIAPDYIELRLGNKSDHMSRQEYGGVSVERGYVTLKRKDARSGFLGIGSSGIFTFPYAELSNGRLFLFLMVNLSGQAPLAPPAEA